MISKNLTTSSVLVPLDTPKIKFEVIHLKDVDGDTFQVKTTLSQQISPGGLAKILFGSHFKFLEKSKQRAFRKHIFIPLLGIVFVRWLFVLRRVATL